MQRSFFGLALVLGLISAVGPFAIDMYLPALPTIGQALGASGWAPARAWWCRARWCATCTPAPRRRG